MRLWPGIRIRIGAAKTHNLATDWHLLAFGFVMMFWSSPGQTYLIALYGAEIRSAFDLNHGQFGAVYSLGTLLSAAAMIWSGRLVDRLDLRTLSLALSLFLALACWYMSFTAGLLSLTIAFFLLRHSGQGLISHVATTAMSRYFENARGKATSIAALGFALAEACLPILTIMLISAVGWRDAWRVTGLVALLFLIPLILWLLRHHQARHTHFLAQWDVTNLTVAEPSRRQWTRRDVLHDRRFYMAVPAFLAPSFFFTGFFFHQVHWVTAKGWSLTWWGSWFVLYAAASLVTTLVTGPLVDRLSAVRLMPLFPLPLALGLAVLSLSDAPFIGLIFLICTGMTTGWTITVMGPLWAEVYGVLHLGAIKALGSALSVFASALSPVLLGWLIDGPLSINILALGSAIYIVLACLLASWAFRSIEIIQNS